MFQVFKLIFKYFCWHHKHMFIFLTWFCVLKSACACQGLRKKWMMPPSNSQTFTKTLVHICSNCQRCLSIYLCISIYIIILSNVDMKWYSLQVVLSCPCIYSFKTITQVFFFCLFVCFVFFFFCFSSLLGFFSILQFILDCFVWKAWLYTSWSPVLYTCWFYV